MLIAGAKGFAKELLNLFTEQHYENDWVFFDDINQDLPSTLYNRFRIIKSIQEAQHHFKFTDNRFVLGVGSPAARFILSKKLRELGGQLTTLISIKSTIGSFGNFLGDGVTVLPNAIIETENHIGEGTLVHVSALISHECRVGNFCEISPSAQLLGKTVVGDFCSIGAGAIILPKVIIGNNVTIGAGAVVTKNVGDDLKIAGVPAREIK